MCYPCCAQELSVCYSPMGPMKQGPLATESGDQGTSSGWQARKPEHQTHIQAPFLEILAIWSMAKEKREGSVHLLRSLEMRHP